MNSQLKLSTQASLTILNFEWSNPWSHILHLLWADDIVFLALDAHSLQTLINHVYDFCCTWGLTVNISKTAVLIFNKNGRLLKDSSHFHFGDTVIPSDRSYCYLGITLTLSGSLTRTMDELRKKGWGRTFHSKIWLTYLNLQWTLSSNCLTHLFYRWCPTDVRYGSQALGWYASYYPKK